MAECASVDGSVNRIRVGVIYGALGRVHDAAGCVILKGSVRPGGVALVGFVLGQGSVVRDGKLVDRRWPMQFRSGVLDWVCDGRLRRHGVWVSHGRLATRDLYFMRKEVDKIIL